MKEKAKHNGHCLYCGKKSKQPFCNRECYRAYIKSDDPTRKKREEKERTELSDRVVKRNIYIGSKGKIKYNQITPEMIIEKRAQILAWREGKANPQPKQKPIKIKTFRACIICGKEYEVKGKSLVCSNECRKADGRNKYYADHDHNLELAKKRWVTTERQRRIDKFVSETKKCEWCGESFTTEYGDVRRTYCSQTCAKRKERHDKHYSNSAIKRYKAERNGEKVKAVEIYERDKWVCQICNKRVNKCLNYPHPMSASLDHIIPIADGGTHTRVNVQLAHLRCNVSIGVGGVKQARLFG